MSEGREKLPDEPPRRRRRTSRERRGFFAAAIWRQPWLWGTLLFAGTLLFWLRTAGFGFVFDDRVQILTDGYVHHLGNFWQLLSLHVLGQDVMDRTRPVQLLSLMLDSALWGLRPAGYHLTNILLHAGSTLLLFLLALRLSVSFAEFSGKDDRQAVGRAGARFGALAAALLFALHPVQVEAVCVPSFREDLLATFFLLAGLLAAAVFADRLRHQFDTTPERLADGGIPDRRSPYLPGCIMVLCLLLAAGAKETGVAGPPLLFLFGWLAMHSGALPSSGGARRRWWPWAALAAVIVGAFYLAVWRLAPAHSEIFNPAMPLAPSLLASAAVQARIFAMDVMHVVAGCGYSAVYTPQSLKDYDLPMAVPLLALTLTAGIIGCLWSRMARFGFAWIVLALLPISNIVPIYNPVADRYLYLPMAGVGLWLAALLARGWRRRALRWPQAAAVAVVAVLLAALSWQRMAVWHDQLSLCNDMIKHEPEHPDAFDGLGYVLYDAGRLAESEAAFRKAISLRKNYADAWAGLAMVREKRGDRAEADKAMTRAAWFDARYADIDQVFRAQEIERQHAEAMRPICRRIQDSPALVRKRAAQPPAAP